MLAGARIGAARDGLEATDSREREAQLSNALVPLAVDAALLGADGLRELALAIARASAATTTKLGAALDE
ncbi:MAG TPA: hypothetical protein VNG33_04895, partial [Polyangiaceae bacterium]|nr:hypothetical protein [Polyangiaceae bacterium]